MRAFWRLCVHELCGLPAYLLCGPAAAAALMLYLTVRRHSLEPDAIFGWTMLALVLLDVLALWLGASVVQREWDSGSVYQLLSLPVSGHAIAGAKLAAALTVVLVPAVMLVLGLLGIFWPGGISSFAPPLPFGVGGRYGGPSELIYAYFIFGPSIAKLFFSALTGVLLRVTSIWIRSPLRWLPGAALIGAWFYGYPFLDLLDRWPAGGPDLPFPGGIIVSGGEATFFFVYLPLWPVLAVLAAGALLFWLAGWLFEHRLEV